MSASARLIVALLSLGFCLAAAGCGGGSEAEHAEPPDTLSQGQEGLFFDLRPGPEDHMVPPRIGFTWRYDPASLGGPRVEEIRFVVHLQGPTGEPYDTVGTWKSELLMDLLPGYSPGEYDWWVEAHLPDGTVERSSRTRFTLVE